MSKTFFAAISIATGILLAPHSVLAAGPTSLQQSASETSQVVQVKESRRIKKRFGRKHRHGHRRHIGGHFFALEVKADEVANVVLVFGD